LWAVVVAIVLAALTMLVFGSSTSPPVGRGTVAPDFSLSGLDSHEPYSLSKLKGKVVLVNFWATWCKPCEEEMPAMERLYRELHPAGLEMLAISVGEEAEVVRAFRDRLRITFPILLDSDKSTSMEWQTYAFPETLLVDRDGVVLERYVGPRDWYAPAYVARLGQLLEAAPEAP
jgi:cytochrome c biogenesis protein CcmG/thiol:disulfide interchange protein DsbE